MFVVISIKLDPQAGEFKFVIAIWVFTNWSLRHKSFDASTFFLSSTDSVVRCRQMLSRKAGQLVFEWSVNGRSLIDSRSRRQSCLGSSSARLCSGRPGTASKSTTAASARSTLSALGWDLSNAREFVQWHGWWCWDGRRWGSCTRRGSRRLRSPAARQSSRSIPHRWSPHIAAFADKCRGCLFDDGRVVHHRELAASDLRPGSSAACSARRRCRWREVVALATNSREYLLCFFLVLYVDVMAHWWSHRC